MIYLQVTNIYMSNYFLSLKNYNSSTLLADYLYLWFLFTYGLLPLSPYFFSTGVYVLGSTSEM